MTKNRKSPAFFTVEELSKLLQVSTMTVYRLIHVGNLEAFKVGKQYRITAVSLQSYLGEYVFSELVGIIDE